MPSFKTNSSLPIIIHLPGENPAETSLQNLLIGITTVILAVASLTVAILQLLRRTRE
ncbi:unnamed protein product [Periconia digitata]|uniref:Uncharacterized protein n=1 Tax=Periconia digitata TaxID=1303443 RepID=A0A9W4XHG2_9PLEO|nr:unnamed protein product [Periconia digitata]